MFEYVRVALDVPLAGCFDYRVELATAADIGRRAVVPFGNKRRVGVIVETVAEPAGQYAIKPVETILDDMPALPADLLELFHFCADYYQHPLGQVIHTALPGRFREPAPFRSKEAQRYQAVDAVALRQLLPARAVMQHRLATELAHSRSEAELRALAPGAWKVVQQWLAIGWVKAVQAVPPPFDPADAVGPVLNAEQQTAVEAIAAAEGFQPFLLHGVTGSGKTEVYLRAIAAALARGRQVLVLVPEINLTPQLETRFRARFPKVSLVSLHSGVADGERAAGWVAAATGQARLVIGTRLAVFTPMPELGLVIVDEEHDSSFKQQDGLRYSARDMAVYRARQRGVAVVLGSATPALESWHNAEIGRYRRLGLSQRAVVGAEQPEVLLLPTRRQPLQEGLHRHSLQAIGERLARREQVLVFLNRRGYAPVMMCGECGWMAACRRCSARFTLHLRERVLRCHYCGLEDRLPPVCPGCGNQDLRPLGQGTQRLEDLLIARFPHAQVLRIDRDSTRRKGSFAAALDDIHGGRADILVGTQMLAKGHDFPRLTLVVVVGADGGLFAADFRAAERLYAQLAQVAGRAGRAEHRGEVIVQTDFPEHPLYEALAQGDYAAFAASELAERHRASFPPFVHQAVLRAEAAEIEDALAFLRQAATLAPLCDGVELFDPVPAAMQRLNDRERAQLLLQSPHRGRLQSVLADWMRALRALKGVKVRWALDVDPLEI
ncbi:primosomal protein N' [Chitinimonas lacunae]|uniref:Replication restart protein PriA n=1 Tax=Chitinimonas lacunae TaxID=1963018 RepID=A0ABV8MLQ7_9NEIS